MTSKLYTSEEVAALFGLTENGLYQYRKRFNLGILKKIQSGRGCPKGNVFYTESDIAFIRSKNENLRGIFNARISREIYKEKASFIRRKIRQLYLLKENKNKSKKY